MDDSRRLIDAIIRMNGNRRHCEFARAERMAKMFCAHDGATRRNFLRGMTFV